MGTLTHFVVFYQPPGPVCAFLEDFSEFLSSPTELEKVLILGDFNIHLVDPSCNVTSQLLSLNMSSHATLLVFLAAILFIT